MNIEERIREIVREELAKAPYATPLVPKYEPNSSTFVISAGGPACGRKDASTCTIPFCVVHSPAYNPPVKMTVHDTVAGPLKLGAYTFTSDGALVYTPPEDKRTGCTCPPGAQTSCPDKACPWKS